ncbi:hypothetical protein CLTEP_27300 [Clostridium tepidiprofundi DSM 19306]|uniref:Phage head-tail adaptor n=1 Tax=Clostridium tepidiprofundi DSM 19306 TaxID=1121338 RepID=A0A151AP91_9CLOT|nr:hypothetical protein [Clostridium tepidiprofundi]KYH29207.1 hypothetical protein CLTEP_27300 [Clostridium tepidiprofundi DSM 19306]
MNKKNLILIIVIMSFMLLLSCGSKEEGSKKESEKNQSKSTFEIKVAENLVKNYMNYLMNENYDDAVKTYVAELRDKTKMIISKDLKIKGYNIIDVNEVGKSGVFKIRVTRTDIERPFSVLDEYTIKVIKDISDYKISDINCTSEKEAFVEEYGIRLKNKNNVETKLIIDKSSIPEYAFAQDDSAKINRIKVPKKSFGRINFSYTGEKLGITTYEKDSFIGVVTIDESLVVQGGVSGGSSNESGGNKNKGTQMVVREKPIGKKIISLDLLKDSVIDFISFSLDEKFVMVQYNKAGSGKCIRVYNTENGNIIPVVFENEYPVKYVDVLFSSFDNDILNFKVVKRKGIEENLKNIVGKWQLDLKQFKIKKL